MRAPAEYPPESPRSRRLRISGLAVSLALTAAALAMVAMLWTGTGLPHESFAHAERLPWPHEALAPLPGIPATFDITSQIDEQESGYWLEWRSGTRGTVLFAVLMICGVATYLLERGRSIRTEPLALLAACLAVAMGYGLMLAADQHAIDIDVDGSPFSAWRTVPAGVVAAVALQAATAVVALIALVRIARHRARRGMSLALFSLFSAPYGFLCSETVFLAPFHIGRSHTVPDLPLARAENARWCWWDPWEWESRLRVIVTTDGRVEVRFARTESASGTMPTLCSAQSDDEGLLESLGGALSRLPDWCWYAHGGSESQPWLDIDTLLAIDHSARFEVVRPVLKGLSELHVRKLQIEVAPPIATASPFAFPVFLARGEGSASDTDRLLTVVELIESADGLAPAGVVFDGVRFKHAAAAADANRARLDSDERFRLQVEDDVPWRDVVHALDALWGVIGLDP